MMTKAQEVMNRNTPHLVMKFGGTSVADLKLINNAAKKIKNEVRAGYQVIVIVSAMAGRTNELVNWTKETSKLCDAREYDAVVSSGENVTAGLMALRLQTLGVNARSWQGWQVPVETSADHSTARIQKISTDNIEKKFHEGMQVAVVAGFQGLSKSNRITTLGRGGSDTTAVAFSAAFNAIRCDIYTDVDGIYTTDPKITSKAKKLEKISFEEMLELASLGAKVLQTRSVEMAMNHKVKLRVLNSFSNKEGTLVCDEEDILEKRIVSGVTYSREEAKVTIIGIEDRPGIAATIFGILSKAGINVDMIVQNISEMGLTDMTFSCPTAQVGIAEKSLKKTLVSKFFKFNKIVTDNNVSKISIVGIGMRSHTGVAQSMFESLSDHGINIKVISTSEIKISVLIDTKYLELAVQALHDKFELEKL